MAKTDLHGPQLSDAKQRLSELEAALGVVSVAGPADARISLGHVERASLPARIHSSPGEYELRVIAPNGETSTRRVGVSAGRAVALTVELPPTRRSAEPVRNDTHPTGGPLRTLGFIALGSSVAIAGASVGMFVHAKSVRDDFVSSGLTDPSLRDAAVDWRTATYATYGAAAITAAVGVVLIAMTSKSTSTRTTATSMVFSRIVPTTL